ncbi:MAG: hypothetical protein WCK58_14945 [Chloroflexota bacterium]
MTPPAPGSLSPTTDSSEQPIEKTDLLEALAAAGEALTDAIVHHDLDAIVAATRRAEQLVDRLNAGDRSEGAKRDGARRRTRTTEDEIEHNPTDPSVMLLGARIGATARRNAMLLEHAWATDAALLRLLAMAARDHSAGAPGAATYGLAAATVSDAEPAGWLDRSA